MVRAKENRENSGILVHCIVTDMWHIIINTVPKEIIHRIFRNVLCVFNYCLGSCVICVR